MPWTLRFTDLIEYVNQGVLTVRLKRNVMVDIGARKRADRALPVLRDGLGGIDEVVLYTI